jgi:hypothetical protein
MIKRKLKLWHVELRHPKHWGEHHEYDVVASNFKQARSIALKFNDRYPKTGYYVDKIELTTFIDNRISRNDKV